MTRENYRKARRTTWTLLSDAVVTERMQLLAKTLLRDLVESKIAQKRIRSVLQSTEVHQLSGMKRQASPKGFKRGFEPKGVWFKQTLREHRGGETKMNPNKFGFHFHPFKPKVVWFKPPLKPKGV